jgi:5-methylcytosine-specific restriction endonuclease McrA
VCQRCGEKVSTDVHHVRKLRDHLEDVIDPENCEALCHGCHSRETARGE